MDDYSEFRTNLDAMENIFKFFSGPIMGYGIGMLLTRQMPVTYGISLFVAGFCLPYVAKYVKNKIINYADKYYFLNNE